MKQEKIYLTPECNITTFCTDSGFASSVQVSSSNKIDTWNSGSDADNDWFKEN